MIYIYIYILYSIVTLTCASVRPVQTSFVKVIPDSIERGTRSAVVQTSRHATCVDVAAPARLVVAVTLAVT